MLLISLLTVLSGAATNPATVKRLPSLSNMKLIIYKGVRSNHYITENTGSTLSCLVVQGNAASTASCEESSAVVNCLVQAAGTLLGFPRSFFFFTLYVSNTPKSLCRCFRRALA